MSHHYLIIFIKFFIFLCLFSICTVLILIFLCSFILLCSWHEHYSYVTDQLYFQHQLVHHHLQCDSQTNNNNNNNNNNNSDSNCNFYSFSLLVAYPNNYLVVCIFVSLFFMVYTPLHPQIFFCGGWTFFLYLIARGLENFKFHGDLLYWVDLIYFFSFFFHKTINDQSCKPKNSWRQNYLFHVCMVTFLTFTWEGWNQ